MLESLLICKQPATRNTYVGQPLEQQKDFYLVTKFGDYFLSSANITLTNMETGILK